MKEDLYVNELLIIAASELRFSASRSGGPGGQYVNKTSTKVMLKWSLKDSKSIEENVRERLLERLRTSMTNSGDIVISCDEFRSQNRNKIRCKAFCCKQY